MICRMLQAMVCPAKHARGKPAGAAPELNTVPHQKLSMVFADGHNKSDTRSMFDILEQKQTAGLSTSSLRRFCRHMARSVYVALFFAIITLWVLFADDLRYATFPPSADEAMGWLSVACMVAFAFEIIMYSFGSRAYVGSFFFWLDLLATASMILDIPAVEDAIFEAISGDSGTLESATLTRATRTSRMGTRAGRIASVRSHCPCGCIFPPILRGTLCMLQRLFNHHHELCKIPTLLLFRVFTPCACLNMFFGVQLPHHWEAFCAGLPTSRCNCHVTLVLPGCVSELHGHADLPVQDRAQSGDKARCVQAMRVVRLFRLMKLFKHVEGHGDSRTGAVRPSRLSIVSPPVQQSRVGQKLSELTTRRVVLGVLAMVFVLPYWDIANEVYGISPMFDEQGLRSLHNQALLDSSGPVFMQALEVWSPTLPLT